MKAPSVSSRMAILPGMSVRDTAQAMGTAIAAHSAVTASPMVRVLVRPVT